MFAAGSSCGRSQALLVSELRRVRDGSARRFILFTVLGDAMWIGTAVTAAGYVLRSQYDQVRDYLNPVATLVLTIVVATYLVRVLTWQEEA